MILRLFSELCQSNECRQHRPDQRRIRLALRQKQKLGNRIAFRFPTQIPQRVGALHFHRKRALHTMALPHQSPLDHRTAHHRRVFQHHFGRRFLAPTTFALPQELLLVFNKSAHQHLHRPASAFSHPRPPTFYAPIHLAILRDFYVRPISRLKIQQQIIPMARNPVACHRAKVGHLTSNRALSPDLG